jgi:hypothetical protein
MPKDSIKVWTLLEYRYRDAANFKARGTVALRGAAAPCDWQRALKSLEDGLFIAEQLGVPPLYEKLYQWSDGPVAADHCWHEFVGFRVVEEAAVDPDVARLGPTEAFVKRLAAVVEWNGALSPHFTI